MNPPRPPVIDIANIVACTIQVYTGKDPFYQGIGVVEGLSLGDGIVVLDSLPCCSLQMLTYSLHLMRVPWEADGRIGVIK